MTFAAELAVARHAAEQAGRIIAARWDQGVTPAYKGAVDLVTEVDLAAEAKIVQTLAQSFPADHIVAEEGSGEGTEHAGDRTWFVDPLDGTTNFAHGFPHFCVSIALADAQGLAVGVIHEPLRRWTFWATRGGGAWRDGQRLQVTAVDRLDRALLATGFPYDRHTNPDNNLDRFGAALTVAQGMRRAGSAALDLAAVAAGWFDGYWEDRLKPWDLAAGALLVAEAGGRVTDLAGGPLDLSTGRALAAGPALHPHLLARLCQANRKEPR
ncbi:MAG: inositol monophosphatase [Myxococcales bacterium]|nr:inositol monophosphatase [Myxococcales bacterium]MCB9526752.1 inositol monophosphatase [Myxococcales bacterium]